MELNIKKYQPTLTNNESNNDIYKKEWFTDCVTRKDKTRQRGKLRDNLLKFMQGFIKFQKENNKTKLQQHFKEFEQFYKDCYTTNNYELSSLCNGNMSEDNKNLIKQGLQIIKNSCLTENKKENKK